MEHASIIGSGQLAGKESFFVGDILRLMLSQLLLGLDVAYCLSGAAGVAWLEVLIGGALPLYLTMKKAAPPLAMAPVVDLGMLFPLLGLLMVVIRTPAGAKFGIPNILPYSEAVVILWVIIGIGGLVQRAK